MAKKIRCPSIGSVVKHTGWRFEKNQNYPCDVYIIRGYYLDPVYQRISNWWTWKRVLPDGKLSVNIENGYGCFEETDNKYDIKITVEKSMI